MFKCKISITDKCTFCENEKETATHLFVHCPFTESFWNSIRLSLEAKTTIAIDNAPSVILFGCIEDNDLFVVVNFILLTGKYYIYLCKMKKSPPTVDGYISFLKYYKNIEEFDISTYSVRRIELVNRKWNLLQNFLIN